MTRQQIYDRIRAGSKDSYILEEMKRLGFWQSSEKPSLPELLIKKEAELSKELNELTAKNRQYGNAEAMLREMRKERMKKAKEKREETKRRNEQKRQEKAERWSELQQHQIIYLGNEVSKGLNHTENKVELLQKYSLPIYQNVEEWAQQAEINLATARYLLFDRKVSQINHYTTFEIPKKSGGKRIISAPKRKLKMLQTFVLKNILNCLPVNDHVHGFVQQRSIVTNAKPHLKKDIVINMDLKDFFPTITYKRIKGLFQSFGYSEQLSTIFALICSQADTDKVELDGVIYYVQKGERFLPQGSPASPAISNLIVYQMDKRIEGLARKFGFTYTRYADDLSFSANHENEGNISKLIHFVGKIVQSEGFTIHPDKIQVMRKGSQQKVTGIVVNEKTNVERTQLRKFRALLHNIEINGWQNQTWGKALHPIKAIEGYIHFVQMVNPTKAIAYKEQLERIISKHGHPPLLITPPVPAAPATPVASEILTVEEKPKERPDTAWWDIF